jgi:AcrR family transcriptional regulator
MSRSGQPAEDVRDPADRRVSRTRRSIDDAFLALLHRRGYDSVGVSDITREADVGRATFYEHYTSKDDLLRSQLRRVSDSMLRARSDEPGVIDATPLFAHVRDMPLLYRLVAGRSAASRSLRVLREVLDERVATILRAQLADGGTLAAPWTPPVAARVLVAGLCALLEWWTEHGMQASVNDLQALFHASTGPMLNADARRRDSGQG